MCVCLLTHFSLWYNAGVPHMLAKLAICYCILKLATHFNRFCYCFLYNLLLGPPLPFTTWYVSRAVFINPRRMHEGYSSRSVCEWVSLSVCVCFRASCYIPVFIRWKQGAIRLFVVDTIYALFEFRWKCFVQKFWRHFLTTTAFFTSCRALAQWKRE